MRSSKAQARGVKYESACGGEIENRGEFDIQWRATDDRLRVTTFQNARVGMLILFAANNAKDKHRVVFDDDGE